MNKVCFRSPLPDSRLSRKLLSESAYPDSVSSKKTVYQRCSSSVSSCCSSLRCSVSLICLSRKICSTGTELFSFFLALIDLSIDGNTLVGFGTNRGTNDRSQ